MKSDQELLPALLFMLWTVNVALADHVRTDYNHNVSVAYIRTPSFGEVELKNPALEKGVKDAIAEDLVSKGWQMVPTGGEIVIFVHDNIPNEKALEEKYAAHDGGVPDLLCRSIS